MDNLTLYLILYIVIGQTLLGILITLNIDNWFMKLIISLFFPIFVIFGLIDLIITKIYRKLYPPKPIDKKQVIEDLTNIFNDINDRLDDKDE